MIKDIKIEVEPRFERGKNAARRLRVAGKIPAVVYGAGLESTALALDPREINQILYSRTGHNTIFNMLVPGGESSPVMIVDWQHDPVTEVLLHIDLERIQLDKPLLVKVPVRLLGEPVGVKVEGGLLEVVHREVEVECLPADIPEQIEVDVSELSIGDTVRASDLAFGERISLRGKTTMVVCHVVEMRAVEEEETTDEEGVEGEGVEGEGAEATEDTETKE
jgi:large subunit ribosomal protein L25